MRNFLVHSVKLRNFAVDMTSKSLYLHIFNILLTVAAYGYLVYRLVLFDDYASLAHSFQTASWRGYLCLAGALALMPVNIYCEAWKWRSLLRHIEPMTMAEAQRQVYYGFVGAFVTPYRTGDYPARVLLMRNRAAWPAAITLGLVGTVAMLVVEIGLGLPAVILFAQQNADIPLRNVLIALAVVVLLLGLLPLMIKRLEHRRWRNNRLQQLFAELSLLTHRRFMGIVLMSFGRYVVWGVQLAMVLYFCGITLTPAQLLITIPTYYLLLGILPSLPVADIAIRGSVSILVFGAFCPNIVGIATAAVVVWIGNTVLPMIVGTLLKKHAPVTEINFSTQ